MSQNSAATTGTTTTSFTISSDESLNKQSLSTNQPNGFHVSNMTAYDSMESSDQYLVTSNLVNNNLMQHEQQTRLHPSSNPPPPPYPLQESVYSDFSLHNRTQLSTDILPSNVNENELKDTKNLSSMIYGTYNDFQPQQQQSPKSSVIQSSYPNSQQHLYSTSSNNDISTNKNSIPNQNGSTNCSPNSKYINNDIKNNNNTSYSPKSFQSTTNKRTSISSLESAVSNSLMPINVKGMLLHGVVSDEVMRAWLVSIKCEEYLKNFIDNGYDMPLLNRMTPQDLTAIGCKSPAVRKKLLAEIKKLNLEDDIPETRPHSLDKWLESLKLAGYLSSLCSEGYNTIDKVCDLTWEDLEEIGITKLGHQKRLLLGIEKIKKLDKQLEEQQNDYAIYDIHPNHRISLNPNSEHRMSTVNRSTIRSGFFQTRSGANLDHRGLPVATVIPAVKHATSSLANMEISKKLLTNDTSENILNGNSSNIVTNGNNVKNNKQIYSSYQEQTLKMSDLSATMKRNPPPMPPVRTNSLKIPDQTIYNNYGTVMNNNSVNGTHPMNAITGSTSFLRTPKLGTLTATTNKMLTSGGHIQSVDGQNSTMRSMPVREAPLPPLPTQPPPCIQGPLQQLQQEFSSPSQATRGNLISPSLIGHQLAGADEFPPPPPSE